MPNSVLSGIAFAFARLRVCLEEQHDDRIPNEEKE